MQGVTTRSPEQGGAPDEFTQTLLSNELPFLAADWHLDPSDLDAESRLLRLARIKAILPANNAIDEKTTHDATLENYVQFALHAAGDRETLDAFLTQVHKVLESEPEEAAELAQQVFWIWAPAAEVAGLYQHKTDLEELAFKALLPGEYEAIRQQYDKTVLEAEDGVISRMETAISKALASTMSDQVTWELQSRPKSNYSVWRKLRSDNRTTAEVFDLIGIRVVVDGEDQDIAAQQCYVAMTAVAGLFEADHGRLKDYIKKPKPSGYRSLHLTLYTVSGLPFELQLRTKEMHIRAETDSLLSHQGYDAAFKETPGKIQRVYEKVPKLYRWRDDATKAIEQAGGIMTGVLQEHILFFREDGNLYKVPKGATMLDASFRVHSRRGLRTRSIAYLDNKPARLTATVQHGDAIKISYRHNYPTDGERFNNLASLTALPASRQAIERGRRKANADENRKKGKLVVLSMLSDVSVDDPFSLLTEDDVRELITRTGLPSFEKLLEVIGANEPSGKPARVANFILSRCGIIELERKKKPNKEIANDAVLLSITVPGIKDVVTDCVVAGCCSERIQQGEDLVVRASRLDENGLKVHRVDCNNIRDHSDTIPCSWN